LDHSNMEMMMQKMQKMQVCMSKIDFNELSALEKESLQIQKKIEDMCAQGKREQADKTAKLFYDKVMQLPALIQIKACTKDIIPEFDVQETTSHVCDMEKMDLGIPDPQRINW
jgi:hypothetical protein